MTLVHSATTPYKQICVKKLLFYAGKNLRQNLRLREKFPFVNNPGNGFVQMSVKRQLNAIQNDQTKLI